MPRAVVEKQLSDKIVDIEKIAATIGGFEYVSKLGAGDNK
jgi:chemotaxis response regulator CheB